jgi:hypothetical protein
MPPFEAPSFQVNRIKVSIVVVTSFVSEIGASGTSWITAPLPASE